MIERLRKEQFLKKSEKDRDRSGSEYKGAESLTNMNNKVIKEHLQDYYDRKAN